MHNRLRGRVIGPFFLVFTKGTDSTARLQKGDRTDSKSGMHRGGKQGRKEQTRNGVSLTKSFFRSDRIHAGYESAFLLLFSL